jgi:hypothetical protein
MNALGGNPLEGTAAKKQLNPSDLSVLIKNDPGSFALYRVTSPTSAETLFYSADRPAYCGYTNDEYAALAKDGGQLVYPEDRARVDDDILKMLKTAKIRSSLIAPFIKRWALFGFGPYSVSWVTKERRRSSLPPSSTMRPRPSFSPICSTMFAPSFS